MADYADIALMPEFLATSARAYDHQENVLQTQLYELEQIRERMQDNTHLSQKLASMKNNKGEIDLNKDEDVKRLALIVHLNYPWIFDHLVTGIDGVVAQGEKVVSETTLTGASFRPMNADQIDIVLKGLDAVLTTEGGGLSEKTFKATQIYDQRRQITEIGMAVARQLHEFLSHINRRDS